VSAERADEATFGGCSSIAQGNVDAIAKRANERTFGAARGVAAPSRVELHATLLAAFSGFANAAHLAEIVLAHLYSEQLLAAQAEIYQARASACLGRAPAAAPLPAAVLFLGHRLRHPAAQLPYVMDALRDELGLEIAVTSKDVWPTWGRPDLCSDTQ
jgi:hypothetical protein